MINILNMDDIWMSYALAFAKFSNLSQDVLIGSVLVYRGSLLSYGWNSSILYNDPSAHAEIIALRMGGRILGNYRLLGTVLYVTLEPCIMCIGAMIQARVHCVVCGARDNKIGWMNLLWAKCIVNHPMINHRMIVKTRVLEKACSNQIHGFFKNRRR